MRVYPGNASLASAVKDRVVATFDQALSLYRQGRTDEVIAGCNLVLQMDPLFDPARKLLEKVRNPSATADVMTGGGGSDDRLAEARQAFAARDFERVIQITTDVLTNDLMNDDARVLSDQARERIEASPFIDQFVRKCEQHLKSGNLAAARGDLDKARALDETHPGVAQIEAMIRKAEATPAARAADSSSFVVDSPSAGARSTAQASDFGFTFEEDKGKAAPPETSFENFSFATSGAATETPLAGGFSFDSPVETRTPPAATPAFNFDAPAPPAAGDAFDFSTASIETTPDDQKKIDQYLSDGDRAFEAADYQQAIDLWSRIFLIDVTNEPASERIEKAKLKRREIDQRLETVLAAGIAAFDRNDFATARAKFDEVLRGDPRNVQAQDYLERLDSAKSGSSFVPPPASSFSDVLDEPSTSYSSSMTPPAPGVAPAATPPRRAATPRSDVAAEKKRSPMGAIAVIAVVLVLAAGWFVWSRMGGEPEQTPAASQGLIQRATILGQQGKFEEAIAVLQEIKPGDGQYDTALAMIADMQQKQASAATVVEGRPAVAAYEESIAAGRAAFAAHDYAAAKQAFDAAIRVKPLPPDLKAAYDTASQEVAKLATARALFAERRYADAITSLQALRASDPSNKSIQRLIIDAHFNIGVRALREDRLEEASRAFDAVLKEDPNDELARRSKELVERYQGQPRDLLYRIYVKYLPMRQTAL